MNFMNEKVNVKQALIEIFQKHSQIQLKESDLDLDVNYGIGIDSLTRVKIVVAIEQKLGIEITETEAVNIKTINQLVNHIQNKMHHEIN
jgi:acyl carrier protein